MDTPSTYVQSFLNLLHQLEKLHGRCLRRNHNDDLLQLRCSANKLCTFISQLERSQREICLKQPQNLEVMCNILEARLDKQVNENILIMMQDLIGRSNTGRRCTYMVKHGVTDVLLRLLSEEAKDRDRSSSLTTAHHILAKLGPKDRKFCIKARLSGALIVTLNLLKSNVNGARPLQSLLTVMKLYSVNNVNSLYLGKHGLIQCLYKVIEVIGRRCTKTLKIVLDIFINLTKLKSNLNKVIGLGGVAMFLEMYHDWQRYDTHNKQVDMRKSLLYILRNVTNLESGKKAFVANDGIVILYESAVESLTSEECECLIVVASLILRRCCPHDTLPVSSTLSPVTFHLPTSNFHVPTCANPIPEKVLETFSMSARIADEGESIAECLSENLNERQPSSSSEAADDDLPDDRDDEKDENDIARNIYGRTPYIQTSEDLQIYAQFFQELSFSDILFPEEVVKNRSNYDGDQVKLTDTNYPQDFKVDVTEKLKMDPTPDRLPTTTSVHKDAEKARFSSIPVKLFEFPFCSEPNSSSSSSGSSLSVRGGFFFCPRVSSGTSFTRKSRMGKKHNSTLSEMGLNDGFQDGFSLPSINDARFTTEALITSLSSPGTFDVFRDRDAYTAAAANTSSVKRFTKLAYPDYNGSDWPVNIEPLYERKPGVRRTKIFDDILRMIEPEKTINRVVYDLDDIISKTVAGKSNILINNDEERLNEGRVSGVLKFNAQFECGNLRKAIQVRDREYDLVINPDINTNHHHQWFYFEVSNMAEGSTYRFNIVNCEKLNSLFNYGMQPVMYSVRRADLGQPCWTRTGHNICYYRNHFTRDLRGIDACEDDDQSSKSYYTATFSVTFPHSQDICYLAYHYPYTYSTLMAQINQWEKSVDSSKIYFKHQSLCNTLGGNPVPVLTITSPFDQLDSCSISESRRYIFLSARVHPGESNSSWVMKGSIEYLLSDLPMAQTARDMYIFKVVPMLNPDGVINGNHRCSLVGEDLNRRWLYPCPALHPTIFHTKGLLLYLQSISHTPLVFCDYHGHSRRKNVFLYGCSASSSWYPGDRNSSLAKSDELTYKILPKILQQIAPAFSYGNCSFSIEKVKESTARVVAWREIGIARSYTMESSYCGCDQGKYKDCHLTIRELQEMGQKFIEALTKFECQRGDPIAANVKDATCSLGDINKEKVGAVRLSTSVQQGHLATDVEDLTGGSMLYRDNDMSYDEYFDDDSDDVNDDDYDDESAMAN